MNRAIIGYELTRVREFTSTIEKLLRVEADEESLNLDQATKGLSPEDRAEFYSDNAEYLQAVKDEYPNQHRLSLISVAYAIFENHLVHLCRMICHQRKSEITLKDFSGNSNLNKARKLLQKWFSVPLDEAQWDLMEDFAALRNIAAHANGQCNGEQKAVVLRLGSYYPGSFSLDGLSQVQAGDQSATILLETIDSFYTTLYKALETWAQVRRVSP